MLRDILNDITSNIKAITDINYALDVASIVAITDHKGVITFANNKFCEMSKFTREEIIGQTHAIINSGYHDKDYFRDMWKTIGSGEVWRGEIRNQAKDGTYYWMDTTIIPCLDEQQKPYKYISIRNDITPRKEAEEQLRKEREHHQRQLTSYVIEAQENERKRISRDLHDGVGQALFSILVGLRVVNQLDLDEKVQAHLEEVQKLTSQTLEEVKSLSVELRPSALDDLGLIPALRSYARRFEQTFGIETTFDVTGPKRRFSPVIETTLYRMCQEAMTNAAKYADSAKVNVHLIADVDRVELKVQDFGRGFDPQHVQVQGTGLGLFGMRERTLLIGGDLQVHSVPGEGTLIHITIPIDETGEQGGSSTA
ncbi:MAG: PAS domain-containing sensor histidine kinase [Tumebacillaceae bacterium]